MNLYDYPIKPENLMSIGEFAQRAKLTADQLRDYGDKGIFKPVLVDENTGHRFYAPQQLTTINFVRAMRKCGFSLKEIHELVEKRSPKALLNAFHKQQAELIKQINETRESLTLLTTYYELIYSSLEIDEDKISVEHMPEMIIHLGGYNDYSAERKFFDTYTVYLEKTAGVRRALPIGGFFSLQRWLEKPSNPDKFFTIDPLGSDKKPEGQYIVGYNRGYYGDAGTVPQRMRKFAEEHNLSFSGEIYYIYLQDEVCVNDPEMYLLQISAKIGKKKVPNTKHPL